MNSEQRAGMPTQLLSVGDDTDTHQRLATDRPDLCCWAHSALRPAGLHGDQAARAPGAPGRLPLSSEGQPRAWLHLLALDSPKGTAVQRDREGSRGHPSVIHTFTQQ